MSPWALALIAPFALCVALLALLLRSPWARRLADVPNERSLHTHPRPRLGGIAIVLGAIPVAAFLGGDGLELSWALVLGLALVSFADDLRSLPIAVRIATHLAAAGLALASLAALAPMPLALTIAATLGVAWMTNLYNFMDGADGLAGGMAAIGFSAYALAATLAGQAPLALASAAIASAALAFLLFNFPPARVFMGDAGSIPLGFLVGVLGVYGALVGAWPAWFPLLVFSPFAVDASVTLARRALRGEPFWRAHRTHYYQRLVLSGWSPRRLAGAFYVLCAAVAVSALTAVRHEAMVQCGIIVVWSAVFVVLIAMIERRGPPESVPP